MCSNNEGVSVSATARSSVSASGGLGVYLCVPYVALSAVLVVLAFASFMRHRMRNKLKHRSRGLKHSERLTTFQHRCYTGQSYERHGSKLKRGPTLCTVSVVATDLGPVKTEPGSGASTGDGLLTPGPPSRVADPLVTGTSHAADLPVTGTARHIWRNKEHGALLTVMNAATHVDVYSQTKQGSVVLKEHPPVIKTARSTDINDTQATDRRSYVFDESKNRRCLPLYPDQRDYHRKSTGDGALTSQNNVGNKVSFAVDQKVVCRNSDTRRECCLSKQ